MTLGCSMLRITGTCIPTLFLKGIFHPNMKTVPFLTLLSCYSNSYGFLSIANTQEEILMHIHTVVLHTVKTYCIVTRSCQTSERSEKYLKISPFGKLIDFFSSPSSRMNKKKTFSFKICLTSTIKQLLWLTQKKKKGIKT